MKRKFYFPLLIAILGLAVLGITLCNKNNETPKPGDIWDIDKDGIPHFVNSNYIALDKIYRISRFRSSVGHDYSDAFEQCRSMKHYFEPLASADWSKVDIFSPVSGEITRVEQEWAGTKLEMVSKDYPAFRFVIFHIQTKKNYAVGDPVAEGEALGTHIGSQTMSDIAVIVNDPTRQGRMVSYFYVLTDQVFNQYMAKGALSRDDFIISRSLRDANPLQCVDGNFMNSDTLQNWTFLK